MRVLPIPRPARMSQLIQLPSGSRCSGRAQCSQSYCTSSASSGVRRPGTRHGPPRTYSRHRERGRTSVGLGGSLAPFTGCTLPLGWGQRVLDLRASDLSVTRIVFRDAFRDAFRDGRRTIRDAMPFRDIGDCGHNSGRYSRPRVTIGHRLVGVRKPSSLSSRPRSAHARSAA